MTGLGTVNRAVSLPWLLDGIAAVAATPARIVDLTQDSREARPGSLFLALRGRACHGLAFAAQAAARGASAILWEPDGATEPPPLPASVFAAPVPDLSKLAGRIADRFFQWPSAQLSVFGFTGTNGKTTCAYLLAQCLDRLGGRAAYAVTLGWGCVGALKSQTHTTPDAISVHRLLASLRADGVREVAMEVSSHALDQHRVAAVRFQSAAFTNLSRDHLDYHESMEAYGAAKARLFEFGELRQIVIHGGDACGRELARRYANRAPVTAVWIGADGPGWLAPQSLHATEVHAQPRATLVELDGTFGRATLRSKLIGRFNAQNSLVVLGCLAARGVKLTDAVAALEACAAPPGRMEVIEATRAAQPMAVVDYAHTPDALAQTLTALREHCRGELWCVFGCGGDRDPGKRALMGAAADELADRIIVTDDNPRSEDPEAIARDILAGVEAHTPAVIHDRARAIAAALGQARSGDVVLIAGKGHEDYQVYGAERRAFSDRREAMRLLGEAA